MTKKPSIPAESIVKIDPQGKYVIQFSVRLTDDEIRRVQDTVEQWWNSDKPFLYLDGGVKIVKVAKPDNGKEKVKGKKQGL